MFVKSAKKITLTNGKTIWIYYLTEEAKEQIDKLLNVERPCVYKRLNSIEERLAPYLVDRLWLLEELLNDEIENKIYLEYRELLKNQDMTKSFRISDFLNKSPIPFYWDIKREIFKKLIETGFIEYRGAGWFKIKQRPK